MEELEDLEDLRREKAKAELEFYNRSRNGLKSGGTV